MTKREFSDLKPTTRVEHSEMNAAKKNDDDRPATIAVDLYIYYAIEVYALNAFLH